jgi:hypothetical protein
VTDSELLEHLAELVAVQLGRRSGWVTVEAVADHLSVEPDFVYAHAAELGGRRLGSGPRGRLRFRLDEVDLALSSCRAIRESGGSQDVRVEPKRRRRRVADTGGAVELLPIKYMT